MDRSELPWNPKEVADIRSRLLRFFETRRRELPWRDGAAPYAVLVAEVMSQQTRVETVVPYYRRWMERFPDPGALAAAEQEEVLSLWQGLGYYSRARNLHRAGRELEARYQGRVPSDPEELRSLPGVGPYTAGAVASIAFGVPEPAVDGNVRRVLARLLDRPDPRPGDLAAWARRLVDPERPGEFNQALMELGSQVCTPRSPSCGTCPLAEFCGARVAGTTADRPAPRRRAAPPHHSRGVAVVALEAEGARRVLMTRRPEDGLLGGMWELPGGRVEEDAPTETGAVDAAVRAASEAAPEVTLRPGQEEPLPAVDHAFSHLRVTYHPFLFRGLRARPGPETHPETEMGRGPGLHTDGGSRTARTERDGGPGLHPAARWLEEAELRELPIPVAQRKILGLATAAMERARASGNGR